MASNEFPNPHEIKPKLKSATFVIVKKKLPLLGLDQQVSKIKLKNYNVTIYIIYIPAYILPGAGAKKWAEAVPKIFNPSIR